MCPGSGLNMASDSVGNRTPRIHRSSYSATLQTEVPLVVENCNFYT
jgi:hypothetical protein